MAIVGIGTDLARIERFRSFVASRSKVIERLFTAAEQRYCLAMKDPAPHLAARFAAKEAYLKSLGTGLRGGLSWQQIEVVRDQLGCPSLRLSGCAADYAAQRAVSSVFLSYSHDGDYAVATVVLEAV